jgi:hypothetical protein
MDGRKRSSELYEALEKLEASSDSIDRRWNEANSSPELHRLVMEMIIKERTGPPEEVERLRVEMAEKLRERDREKDAYLLKWKALRKELESLTRNVVNPFIQELHRELEALEKKRINEIISKSFDGFNSRTLLKVKTNDEGLKDAHTVAQEGISRLQGLYGLSIPMIEAEFNKLLEKLRRVDISKTVEKEIDENTFFRGYPPSGQDPTYGGPRSGFRI